MNLLWIFALAVVGLFILGLAFRHAVRRGADTPSQDEAAGDSIQAFDEGIQAAQRAQTVAGGWHSSSGDANDSFSPPAD